MHLCKQLVPDDGAYDTEWLPNEVPSHYNIYIFIGIIYEIALGDINELSQLGAMERRNQEHGWKLRYYCNVCVPTKNSIMASHNTNYFRSLMLS